MGDSNTIVSFPKRTACEIRPEFAYPHLVPSRYTKERPPVNFTQKTYDMRFEEHPIGRKFPVVDEHNDNVQSFDVLDSLRGITQTENSTTVLDDWIHTDKAQLGLHVVSFKDATLVTLTC